jgi:thymidylate synthase (FAD)
MLVIQVSPVVYLVASPMVDYDMLAAYMDDVGGADWIRHRGGRDAQDLVEAAGRTCYRSWAPGLNPNVSKVRSDQDDYLENVLAQYHGSVLEHANFTFIFHQVSRVFTHELVRHRAGTAVSQESMRFVRLTEIPFWFPEWAQEDKELMGRALVMLTRMEEFQQWMSEHFKLDEPGTSFHEKKLKTSFMRRFAPEGVASDIMWTANIRTLRHVIESRTATGAEEEIRKVFGMVAGIMKEEAPALFGDYAVNDDGQWVPAWRKV